MTPVPPVDHVELLVEEPSMEELLRALLPQVLGGIDLEIRRFGGKADLLKKLPERLAGYARQIAPHLDLARNRSRSFGKLRELLTELARG